MPRISRKQSKSIMKTYHVLLRGINKQDIFIDNVDKSKFFKELKEAKEEFKFKLYAYAIMNNHVHLVIYDDNDKLSETMHKVETKYALYFNKKYERVGHVFQNRYKSICVETEAYLKNLVRYVLRNPQKDGICPINEYNWSSYKEYVYKENITDVEFILQLFSMDMKQAVREFLEFCNSVEDRYSDAEFEIENTMTDEQALDCIKRIVKIDLNILNNCNQKYRDKYIYEISKIRGISVKQMVRLLGIEKSNIYRIIDKMSKEEDKNSIQLPHERIENK